MSDTTTDSSVDKKRRIVQRKPSTLVLAWATEAECKLDEAGRPIAGTGQRCYVPMRFPPTLDKTQYNNKAAIKAAVRNAVYECGLKEYGNKPLVILSYSEEFEFPFVAEIQTVLRPPKPGENCTVIDTYDPYDDGK